MPILFLILILSYPLGLRAEQQSSEESTSSGSVLDLREEESKLKFQWKDHFVVVPMPVVNPTFGDGLILGGAYYYSQTEKQKETQPASFTAVGGGYTNTDSNFYGVMQRNYWNEDRWRFKGVAAHVDLKFLDPAGGDNKGLQDWLINGNAILASISRKIAQSPWYLGLHAHYLDINQEFVLTSNLPDFSLQNEIESTGLGIVSEYDTRDQPTNAYNGRLFEMKAIFSETTDQDVNSYESYFLRYRSYHQLNVPVVMALDVNACKKSGKIPLWDTCRLNLRGFPTTKYLGKESLSAQVEARWKFYKKWGMVAFAGAGDIGNFNSANSEDDLIPSYGLGLRFMVMEAQRINIRVDYGRSDNDDAWYLSATEAF